MTDRPAEAARPQLLALRNGLLRLHKTLLDSEAAVYQRDVQPIRSNSHLLELVLNDPWFGWLRELSELVVLIDEALDAKEQPVAGDDAGRFLAQAALLLTPDENGAGFRKHYFEALQRDPDVVLAHAAMMKTLASLRQRAV